MTKGTGLSRKPDLTERRQFRLKPNVHFQGVAWYQDEGVFAGEVLTDRVPTVRLFAPEGAPEPKYIDVPSHWVKPARG